MTKVSADSGGKGIADVLEVDDPDMSSLDVVEEVVLVNVGMIDEEIVRERDGRRRVPRTAKKR